MGKPRFLQTVLYGAFSALPLWVWIAFSGLIGTIMGLGLYTFAYGRGFSYLSNDPQACINCHVMRDVWEGWNHSSHKAVASCNDCHIPHNLPAKYYAKALNGLHHSAAFTTGNFHEPIKITKFNRDILKRNCLHCHGSFIDPIIHQRNEEPIDCLHCHSRVGHGW
jgi:cytochrome c nitrite reductase small subunit